MISEFWLNYYNHEINKISYLLIFESPFYTWDMVVLSVESMFHEDCDIGSIQAVWEGLQKNFVFASGKIEMLQFYLIHIFLKRLFISVILLCYKNRLKFLFSKKTGQLSGLET